MAKIECYTAAGWWEEKNILHASPLLCIPKKDGRLRTVVDCRERNLNTIKDLMPFPDQDMIRNDVACAPFRSKLDMSDAYKQVHVDPNDMKNTVFCTVIGTFLSHVVQQGDCNTPATFQRLMTRIFRSFIRKFVYVYLDDIFIFSYTVEEHESHLCQVFDVLRAQSLYLSVSRIQSLLAKPGHARVSRPLRTSRGTVVLVETKIGWGICHSRSRYFIHPSNTNKTENTSCMNA
jgi:hypothetical protein